MKNSAGLLAATALHWSILSWPGGGWMTGMSIGPDNTVLVGCDTTTPMILDPGATVLRQTVRLGITVPIANKAHNSASYGVDIFPGDSNRMGMITMDGLFVTADKGATFAKKKSIGGLYTDDWRMYIKRLAFDPADYNTIVYCVQSNIGNTDQVQYTTNLWDANPTWHSINGIPAADVHVAGGLCEIAFDASSATVGGHASVVYIRVPGHGVYRSTTGITGAFTLIAGSPVTGTRMAVGPGGRCYVVGASDRSQSPTPQPDASADGPLYYMDRGGSAFTVVNSVNAKIVAPDPSNASRVAVINGGGGLAISTDGGATFSTTVAGTRVAPDSPFLETTNEFFMSAGDAQFDHNGRLYFSEGIGLWFTDNPVGGQAFNWTARTLGQNNMIGQHYKITPRGTILESVQDRGFAVRKKGTEKRPLLRHGPSFAWNLQHAQSMDYANDDPTYLVGCTYAALDGTHSGTGHLWQSFDEGDHWSELPSIPPYARGNGGLNEPVMYGCLAVSNKGNMVFAGPTGRPAFTKDGGVTWALCDFGAAANADLDIVDGNVVQSIFKAYTFRREPLIANKEVAGEFHLYIYGDDAAASPASGYWRSTDGGATMTRTYAGHFVDNAQEYYNSHFKCVPGHPGHVIFAGGDVSGNYDNPQPQLKMRYGKIAGDNTMTWADVATPFGMITGLDFGKNPNPAAPCAALYAFAEGVGTFECVDLNPATLAETWTQISGFPMGNPGDVNCLAADMNAVRRIVLGVGSCGGLLGEGGSVLA